MEIINFENREIRTLESGGQTWYAVVDIIDVLVGSRDPGAYWRQLKKKLKDEGSETVNNFHAFKLKAADGKMRKTDCLTRESILRLIQSISSPKVEPFKQWLANAGEQNIKETEDPDLIFSRMIDGYRKQGRSEDWIKLRIRSLIARNELTDTWRERDVKGNEYAILTDEIHSGTFDMTTRTHKEYKGLNSKDSLRENMSDLELLFTTFSESLTKEMIERLNAQGFNQNREVAKEAGHQTGESRKRLEKRTGISVISKSKWLKGKKDSN